MTVHIYESTYITTADKEINTEAIFMIMNTT